MRVSCFFLLSVVVGLYLATCEQPPQCSKKQEETMHDWRVLSPPPTGACC